MERAPQVEQEAPAAQTATAAPPAPVPALAWASAAGNQAVAALARAAADGSHGSPGVPQTDFDPRTASDDERVAEIRRRLAEGGWLKEVWRSFADVRAVANANAELWKASVAREPALAEDEQVLAGFRQAVEAIAVERLSENRDEVWREMHDLGVSREDDAQPGEDELAAVERLQALADEVNRALQLKLVLLQIPVGFHEETGRRFDAADPQGRKGESKPALFAPGKPPVNRNAGGPGFRSYESVAEQYAKVEETLARGMAHPALFAMVEQAGGPADKDAHAALRMFAGERPELAQATASRALHTLMAGIEATTRQIGGGVDYRDLRPVHDQVLARPPFSGAYERSVAAAAIDGHDTMKTLLSFGLAAVQAIALLATPLLGPAALIPIVGAGVAQAGMSYSDYQRLKTARAARTGAQGGDVVAQETVDAAQLAAILDAVFLFVDGIEGFAAVAKAAKLGAKAGAAAAKEVAEDLPRLAALEPGRRDAVLGEAMATLGPGPAIDRAGGIETVRSAAAGTPAALRAEGYVAGLEDGLAHHLAGAQEAQAASEPLLPRAAGYVAEQAQVPEPRALGGLLPHRRTEPELQDLIARVAKQIAPEWATRTPAEREALVRVAVRDEARAMGVPVPWLIADPALDPAYMGMMDPKRWAVLMPPALFQDATVTMERLTEIMAKVRHEVRHGLQFVEGGRYAVFHAGNRDFIAHLPPDVQAEILKRGPLTQGSTDLTKARGWYEEWAPPNGATSLGVRKQLETSAADMAASQARLGPARDRWAASLERALQADGAGEDAAAADLLAAYGDYTKEGTTFQTKSADYAKARADYSRLPTEADAEAAEQTYVVEEHRRWVAAADSEVERGMLKAVGKGLLVLAGGAAAGGGVAYASYQRAPPRTQTPAR